MTKYQVLFPRSRLLRLLRSDVAWQRTMFLSTAAVHDLTSSARSSKRISKDERKARAEAYIKEYRMMNAGKFPTATDIQKQVGGCYYNIRAVLQELKHNSKLPAVATADKNSMVGQTAQVNEVSDVGVILDFQVPECRAVVADDYGVSAEYDPSSQEVDKNICQRMVDMSTLTKINEITAEDISQIERMVNLEHEGKHHRSSTADVDRRDNRFMERRDVSRAASLVEKTSVNENVNAIATDDSELPAKPHHPSEVPSLSRKTEPGKVDEATPQASESDEVMRTTTMQKTEVSELQKTSLWCNLKSLASNIISIWRKI